MVYLPDVFLNLLFQVRLLAVPFQSVERASESRKQARRDWSERTSRSETGGESAFVIVILQALSRVFPSRATNGGCFGFSCKD